MEKINISELKGADRIARGCRYVVVTRSHNGGLIPDNTVHSSHRTADAAEKEARKPVGNWMYYSHHALEVVR
jgi:hypothetical protein